MHRLCAIVFLAASLASCALAHERNSSIPLAPLDAGFAATPDVSLPPHDGSHGTDASPTLGCFGFWNALPSCPAVPMAAIGQPCAQEGTTCGVHCCEPGPPIGCQGGRWTPLDVMDDCSGVRCRGPHPCGAGACAFDRVCLIPSGEIANPSNQCVLPPAPIDSCAAAPPGSIDTTNASCTTCSCGTTPSGEIVITLDCACC